ncbi:TRAP-type C4-dicarboxylate transport system, periplasmic component [Vibrio chagasii]|uniref:TRAP transporter substrate-binding protein n=1 Tax=Vibrio chagasii TaxID=170679 RepID=UPI00163F6331|nr:TRAP transporter substrate-binding protein [Vibrio chagasii]CAH6972875.1 TRAP-type C4-dicarboxylate transport system, periplasmic component [Vibrio chagasii]CAH6976162.1 TRAP-type C4-dicarboxylate transport system, periplasmic component [Vibrio chagasii]CAH7300764.1 TRAP-type C4-dicarboxylate transport system, periplasmic component [Vibrio chagasii]CAH7323500.1 TRAP-type C4-dicarboxylate transport system, periplasmic component [Vibrio chagasii]CAH7325123.1 TRAP-type C4-dicarboxylate transpo
MKRAIFTSITALGLTLSSMNTFASNVIRLAHDSQETSPVHKAMLHFEKELESRSNGELEVEIYPARQLGDVRETTELVQQGNLQMTFGASVLLSPYVPEFNVLDVFYLFEDETQAHKALDSDKIGKPLLNSMESKGFHGLGFMEVGFRSITNNKQPINSIEDLNSLKIRSASNPTQISAWKSVGTAPTPLSWGEIFTSLQQGLINSQESAVYSIYAERFYEAQEYLSLTNHIYTNYVLFMNKEFWDSLPSDQQALINEVSQETIAVQRDLAAKQNQEVIKELEAKGMTVNVVPTDVRAQMKEKMNAAVYQELRSKTGEALFDSVITEIEQL